MANRRDLRCTLVALLTAWVTMVFVPSAMIALLGFSNAPNGTPVGLSNLPATTWEVADEVGPAAKLLMIALFAALVLLGERLGPGTTWKRYALNIALGIGAMLLVLGLLPEALSRGFGIGLTGARFDPSILSIYLVGGVLGGLAFTVSVTKCRAKAFLTA